MSSRAELPYFYASFCCLVILSIVAAVNLGIGTDDINFVGVFESDEHSILQNLSAVFRSGNFDPQGYYKYGFIYQSLGLILLKLLGSLNYAVDSERVMILVMRVICLAAYIGMFSLFYATLRQVQISRSIALAFSLLLASFPESFRWSQTIHPDMLQQLFIILGIYFVSRGPTLSNTILAAAAAGLAFGTKYGGVFILPFLLLPYLVSLCRAKDLNSSSRYQKAAFVIIVASFTFVSTWLLTNPSVPTNFTKWLEVMSYENNFRSANYSDSGARIAESTSGFLWLPILNKEFSSLGSLLIASGLISWFCFALHDRYRKSKEPTAGSFAPPKHENTWLAISMLLFCFCFLGYAMLEINYRVVRFLMPMFPALLLVSAIGLSRLKSLLPGLRHVLLLPLTVISVLICFSAIESQAFATRKYEPNYLIDVGRKLAQTHPPSTRILADFYTYFPSGYFTQAPTLSWRITSPESLNYFDVIVLNKEVSGRYHWKKDGTKFREGNFVSFGSTLSDEFAAFHRWLFLGKSGYRIFLETPKIVVLESPNFSRPRASRKRTESSMETPEL